MAERPIGYWLKLVDRLIDERFAAIIEEHGVTRRQWQLLGVIAEAPAPGITVVELDAAIAPFLQPGVDESSEDDLDELVDSDWVARALAGDVDAYTLTERGQGALARLSEVVGALRETVGAGLSEEEYATTLHSLESMARNLGWSDQTAS